MNETNACDLHNTYILSKLHNLNTYECSLVANHIHTYFSKIFCSLLYLVSHFQSWARKLPIYEDYGFYLVFVYLVSSFFA